MIVKCKILSFPSDLLNRDLGVAGPGYLHFNTLASPFIPVGMEVCLSSAY